MRLEGCRSPRCPTAEERTSLMVPRLFSDLGIRMASCSYIYIYIYIYSTSYNIYTRVKPYKECTKMHIWMATWDGMAKICLPQY